MNIRVEILIIFWMTLPIIVPISLCLYDKYVMLPELRKRGMTVEELSKDPFKDIK